MSRSGGAERERERDTHTHTHTHTHEIRRRLKWGELRVCVLFNKRGKKSKLKKL